MAKSKKPAATKPAEHPDKLSHIDSQVSDVTNVAQSALQGVIDRGERLTDLEEKTKHLEEGARAFKQTSKEVRRNMWWKNAKLWLAVALVTTIIVVGIVAGVVSNVRSITGSGGGGGSGSSVAASAASEESPSSANSVQL